MLTNHNDTLPAHAEGPHGIRMQCALDVVDVRKSDVRAPSTWAYKYTLHLANGPQDGEDVGLEGVWRRATRGQMRVRGRVVAVGVDEQLLVA